MKSGKKENAPKFSITYKTRPYDERPSKNAEDFR